MQSINVVIEELTSLSGVVAAQIEVGIERDDVVISLFNSWKLQLAQLTPCAGEARELTVALSMGPWNKGQKCEVALVLLDCSSRRDCSSWTAPQRKHMQACLYFGKMLNEDTCVNIRTSKSKAYIVNILAHQHILPVGAHSLPHDCHHHIFNV